MEPSNNEGSEKVKAPLSTFLASRGNKSETGGASIEIDGHSIFRVILQFLVNVGLTRTAHCLQEESGVSLDAIESLEKFRKDVHTGNWVNVLDVLGYCKLPQSALFNLYEHIVLEFIEAGDKEHAERFLRDSHVLEAMKTSQSATYKRLSGLVERMSSSSASSQLLYGGTSKSKRRRQICEELESHLEAIPNNRLLEIIGSSIIKDISSSGVYDVMTGRIMTSINDFNQPATSIRCTISVPSDHDLNVVTFASDDKTIALGDSKGFIEIWSYVDNCLRKDLTYQQQGKRMGHDSAITSLVFSPDCELLASGDESGTLKIWGVTAGVCRKKFENLHSSCITSIVFHLFKPSILTSSLDGTSKLTSVVSKSLLSAYHTPTSDSSYTRCSIFDKKGNRVITGSDDGHVISYNRKTAERLASIPAGGGGGKLSSNPVVSLSLNPKDDSSIYVLSKSPQITLMDPENGALIKSFSHSESQDFVTMTVSPDGSWVYAVSVSSSLVVFNSQTAELCFDIRHKDFQKHSPIGIVHHPQNNLVAAWNAKEVYVLGPF